MQVSKPYGSFNTGLPRQSSTGSISPSLAPPLPPRTRRGTDAVPSPPRSHRPVGKELSTCTVGYSFLESCALSIL